MRRAPVEHRNRDAARDATAAMARAQDQRTRTRSAETAPPGGHHGTQEHAHNGPQTTRPEALHKHRVQRGTSTRRQQGRAGVGGGGGAASKMAGRVLADAATAVAPVLKAMATRAMARQCAAVGTAERLGGQRVGRRRWWRRWKSGRGGGGGGIAGLVEEEGPPPPGLVPDPTTVEQCDTSRPPAGRSYDVKQK